jgi:(2Fe-2S) ferredoxin
MVTVCRGCCCGTPKVPRLDHTAQLADLRQSLADVATVRRTDCLDACERANVIVIQPSAEGRQAGGRPVWLGLVNDTDAAADITAWVTAGGPGLADPPDILDLYIFNPSRRVRHELDN